MIVEHRCKCGRVHLVPAESARCPCTCHDEALRRARERGLYCQICGYSSDDPERYRAHLAKHG